MFLDQKAESMWLTQKINHLFIKKMKQIRNLAKSGFKLRA